MFKKLVAKLLEKDDPQSAGSDGFFLDVRCSECSDKFHLFIYKSWELSQNFEKDGSVTYFLKKTIFGVGCPNRIHVEMKSRISASRRNRSAKKPAAPLSMPTV